MKNIEIEIIDYTTDEVFYFVDDVEEAEKTLETLHEKFSTHEIGVSYFSVNGVQLPFTKQNRDFIKEFEEEEIEAVLKYYENEFGLVPNVDLHDVQEYMDNSPITFVTAENEIDAFIEFYEEIGLYDEIPSNLISYIDWEKLMQDYQFNTGLSIYRLSYEHPTNYRFMICY